MNDTQDYRIILKEILELSLLNSSNNNLILSKTFQSKGQPASDWISFKIENILPPKQQIPFSVIIIIINLFYVMK